MEYWSDGVLRPESSAPILQHSITSLSSEHFSELFAPALQFLVVRQAHDDNLIILHVLLEFVVDLGMKDVFADVAEGSLRLRTDEKLGEQPRRVGMRRLPIDSDEAQRREVLVHAHVFDGSGILIFVFDVANGHGNFAGRKRLNRVRQAATQTRLL